MKSVVKRITSYFTRGELLLWSLSVLIITVSFFLLDRENVLTLIASLVGATALIFNDKGNPVGQVLMVVFSIIYGIISYTFSYYGEMITYLGMSMPMAIIALVTVPFWFVLRALDTANLFFSTVSVATSFLAVYLTFRRSAFYAVSYAANDVVLIILWTLATIEDASYLSVTLCFFMFLANDIYGFVNWSAMRKRQLEG